MHKVKVFFSGPEDGVGAPFADVLFEGHLPFVPWPGMEIVARHEGKMGMIAIDRHGADSEPSGAYEMDSAGEPYFRFICMGGIEHAFAIPLSETILAFEANGWTVTRQSKG